MTGVLEGKPLAVFRRREAGEIRIAALDGGTPPFLVAFETPDLLASVEYEAAAGQAIDACRKTPGYLERYGLQVAAQLTDLQVAALSRAVTAMESAFRLLKDWTKAEIVDGEVRKVELTPQAIAEVLSDANLRAAWLITLDAASPLERLEGNVSAVSPTTTSGAAATTAAAASPSTGPAPRASRARRAGSAPGLNSPRKPRKAD